MERKLEPKRRPTPVARAARRRRILARRRHGWTYQHIAQAEGLTPARIGQIVRQGFDDVAISAAEAGRDRRVARLLAALGVASRAVGRGDLTAIDPLIRALDRFRGRPTAEADSASPLDTARERLLAKIDHVAAELSEGDRQFFSRPVVAATH